jgi:hypothetical protein
LVLLLLCCVAPACEPAELDVAAHVLAQQAPDPDDPGAANRAAVLEMLDGLPVATRLIETVSLRVKLARQDEFLALTQDFIADTQAALGAGLNSIEMHELVQPFDGAVEFQLVDDYADTRFVRKQWLSDRLREFQAAQVPLLVAAPDLRFYFY